MAKVSEATATGGGEYGPVTDRSQEVDGWTISFVTFHEDVDATPLLKGLPGDNCQCPHWGYVISGRLQFRYPDHEEAFEAGDAFYTEPGHVPFQHDPGTQIVLFSPTDQLRATDEAMQRNVQAMQA